MPRFKSQFRIATGIAAALISSGGTLAFASTSDETDVVDAPVLVKHAAFTHDIEAKHPEPEPIAAPAYNPVWDQLAQCEATGDWHINTGNGYHGGLQFASSTWAAFGGTEYAPQADLASKEQQIAIAERVQAEQGWGAWPACSTKLGLR